MAASICAVTRRFEALLCVMLTACAPTQAVSAQDSSAPDDRIAATVDGEPIYSKQETGRFPEHEEVLAQLRNR